MRRPTFDEWKSSIFRGRLVMDSVRAYLIPYFYDLGISCIELFIEDSLNDSRAVAF